MKKEIKLNNRGFTLIEVLAVIVILVIIVAIAIPNISASLDRQTCNTTKTKAKLIESAAQFYVSDNRNDILKKLNDSRQESCKINIDDISDLTDDDKKDSDGNDITGYIIYKIDETYKFCFDNDTCDYNDGCPNDLSTIGDCKS